ncbi:hypothetical protein F0562_022847 [Nyssa sinensis]|uniref:Uncharacterized protein n=1 Tax=Nyssa sinensis TaxID=561372 RepID=A0A5J5BET7_9ASTE|nr:hypothetical protein F0562_022847 [Nyssa sinensis]
MCAYRISSLLSERCWLLWSAGTYSKILRKGEERKLGIPCIKMDEEGLQYSTGLLEDMRSKFRSKRLGDVECYAFVFLLKEHL